MPDPLQFSSDNDQLVRQVVDYYHERLFQSPKALAYLEKKGIDHEIIKRYRIGYGDRSLGLKLPSRDSKEGARLRGRLIKVGLFRRSGHEHLNGAVVLPVFNADGNVLQIYGRMITSGLRAGTELYPKINQNDDFISEGEDSACLMSLFANDEVRPLPSKVSAKKAEEVPPVVEAPAPLPQPVEEPVPVVEQPKDHKPKQVEASMSPEDIRLEIGDRSYRIRGLTVNQSFHVMKVNMRVLWQERYYLDTVDLYHAKQRERFIKAAAEEIFLKPAILKKDMGRLLLELERLQEERISKALQPKGTTLEQMSQSDENEALNLLRDPNLLERITADMETCGLVGERTNKLTAYLAAVSRKLDKPLAIIIQSSSAAGKTTIMDAVLELMPEEERIKYSAMTGQSLYYMGDTDLKHKILAIAEEEGASKASYALKLLQSEGELTIASTTKDENGRMTTDEYQVEGPVMIFLTTTSVDLDEELVNRALVLTVDESREQTEAIHALQREAETFDGLRRKLEKQAITKLHQNAQRLLRPLHVVNPYAPQLSFMSDKTRSRRDHSKYLGLIRAVTLLHQYQRPVKTEQGIEYVEATPKDIEIANALSHEVLGRSLDDVQPQTRRLLGLLHSMVKLACEEKQIDQTDYRFTRKDVRAFTGWSDSQLKVHLKRLVELEYLIIHSGSRGHWHVYELAYRGEGDDLKCFVTGLTDRKSLNENTSLGAEAASLGQVCPKSEAGLITPIASGSSNHTALFTTG